MSDELKEALEQVVLWKAQANHSAVTIAELCGEKQRVERQLNEARSESVRLQAENAALKRGEAGELLAKAQKEAVEWKELFERCSESFRTYRQNVESGEIYETQRKVMFLLADERDILTAKLGTAQDVADGLARVAKAVEEHYDDGCLYCGYKQHAPSCSLNNALAEYRKLKESGTNDR